MNGTNFIRNALVLEEPTAHSRHPLPRRVTEPLTAHCNTGKLCRYLTDQGLGTVGWPEGALGRSEGGKFECGDGIRYVEPR